MASCVIIMYTLLRFPENHWVVSFMVYAFYPKNFFKLVYTTYIGVYRERTDVIHSHEAEGDPLETIHDKESEMLQPR